MTLAVNVPPGYEAERRYAAHVLLGEFLGLDWRLETEQRADIRITLDGQDGELTYADRVFALPEEAWLTRLPELAADDPFGTAFFFLTRYEELLPTERDRHARFLAATATSPHRPVVNELLEDLWRDLRRVFPRLERRRRSFEVLPTHDIDILRCPGRSPRALSIALLKLRDPALTARRLCGADPCDTFDFLLDASERRGLRSAFYFMADDDGYRLADTRDLLRDVHVRGHEVGLHASYDAYRDSARTRSEFERLRAAADAVGVEQRSWGGRQHFLRWDAPTTWQVWEDAGLDYDSTVGWAEHAGFRAGVCYEYPVFNLKTRRMLNLRERPLIAMEATFLQYMELGAKAFDAMAELKRTCRRYDGQFVVLWHNNRLQTARDRRLYEAVLDA
jgi:hypothetical protein